MEATIKETVKNIFKSNTFESALDLLREANDMREDDMDIQADAIDRIAAKLIGRKDCIKWKLHKGFALSETDNEYITDNLR